MMGKAFGNKWALSNLDLSVENCRVSVLGQNGSGKTTFLAILCGLLSPTIGELTINGINPSKERNKLLKNISFTFERAKIPSKIRVGEFVKFVGVSRDDPKGAEELSMIVGLESFLDCQMRELSAGQEQLVNLFNGLCSTRGIIVLDEPFSHLDILRSGRIMERLSKSSNELVFSTHIPEEAEYLSDYILVLSEGKCIWSGSIRDLMNEEIYEIYQLPNMEELNAKIIYNFGNIALVRGSFEEIASMLKEGKIIGFRKAGVRKIYGEIKART